MVIEWGISSKSFRYREISTIYCIHSLICSIKFVRCGKFLEKLFWVRCLRNVPCSVTTGCDVSWWVIAKNKLTKSRISNYFLVLSCLHSQQLFFLLKICLGVVKSTFVIFISKHALNYHSIIVFKWLNVCFEVI